MYNNTEKRLINGILYVKKRESYFSVLKEPKEKAQFHLFLLLFYLLILGGG